MGGVAIIYGDKVDLFHQSLDVLRINRGTDPEGDFRKTTFARLLTKKTQCTTSIMKQPGNNIDAVLLSLFSGGSWMGPNP